jgi:hypothetical protein
MKTLKKLILSLFVTAMVFSCDGTLVDDSEDTLTGNSGGGGLVSVGNPLLSYVVGSGNTYTAAGSVFQGNIQTTAINVYNTFTDNASGSSSNRVLLTTVAIADLSVGSTVSFTLSFTYEDLIAGITLDGSSLPANDGALNIGDFWTLDYEATTSEGNQHGNANTTKVAVGTRYAGIYTVDDSAYWNSGSFLGNWSGGDRIIESVDATIYRHKGLAYWDDNEFYFEVDNGSNYITVYDVDLAGDDLLLNGSPAMTCGAYDFEMIPCDSGTSRAIPNDVTGEDVLEFTVGYFRGVGATREFFERLVKQVD